MHSDRQYKEKATEIIRRANDAVYASLGCVPDSTIENELRPELQRVKGRGVFVSAWVFVADAEFEDAAADSDATGSK